ncbi:MAG: hypothetical protein IJ468_03670 [Lachnospiraceae bacterium]|nr:hypothetical protein [Lachnospiraceae bacterium]
MIYMAPFYRMYLLGKPLADVLQEILTLYQMSGGDGFDSRIFFHFHAAKKRLACRIVNYDANRDILRRIPHRRFLDFAVVYYLSLEGKNRAMGSALVYNDYLKVWETTGEEIHRIAVENTPKILPGYTESLDQVLEGLLMPSDRDGSAARVYVISNSSNFFGAWAAFYPGLLKELAQKTGSDLYLLPSSVHEFLAVPVTGSSDVEELERLVSSMNHTHVAPDEVLSDHVYYYCRSTERVTICRER